MLEAALYPGLSALGVANNLGIDRSFQSLRIAEGTDREALERPSEEAR